MVGMGVMSTYDQRLDAQLMMPRLNSLRCSPFALVRKISTNKMTSYRSIEECFQDSVEAVNKSQ